METEKKERHIEELLKWKKNRKQSETNKKRERKEVRGSEKRENVCVLFVCVCVCVCVCVSWCVCVCVCVGGGGVKERDIRPIDGKKWKVVICV